MKTRHITGIAGTVLAVGALTGMTTRGSDAPVSPVSPMQPANTAESTPCTGAPSDWACAAVQRGGLPVISRGFFDALAAGTHR